MGFLPLLLALLPSAVALVIAWRVTRRIADATLKKDLFEPRYKVFEDVRTFIKPILGTPHAFSTESDKYRHFGETLQRADMLFGPEVRDYLRDVNTTAGDLCFAHRRMANDPGDINAPQQCHDLFERLQRLFFKRPDVFRRDISVEHIETAKSRALMPLVYFGIGLIVGSLALKLWPEHAETHRVSINYPSRWEPGELRNCRLGKGGNWSNWPELECDGSGSHVDAKQGAHEFVMDVSFHGKYRVPADTSTVMWTCQSSSTSGLTCKDWR